MNDQFDQEDDSPGQDHDHGSESPRQQQAQQEEEQHFEAVAQAFARKFREQGRPL